MLTNKEIISEFFRQAYDEKNDEFVRKYFSEDYMDHSPAAARGNEGAIQILKVVREGFSDIQTTMLDLIEEDGMVVARLKFEGTHMGQYMGVLPSEKRTVWEAIEIFKVVSGKVVESWGYWPDLDILTQLTT